MRERSSPVPRSECDVASQARWVDSPEAPDYKCASRACEPAIGLIGVMD